MFLISDAYAQNAAAAAEPGLIANILPLIIIFVIFYFLLIRPQQKKLQAHDTMVKGIARGNEVVTGGGIIGKVTKVEDEKGIIHVEIAPGVNVRVNRASVTEVLAEKAKDMPEKPTEKKNKKKS